MRLPLVLAVIVSIFSGLIVKLLFGPEYLGSILALKIGVWSVLGIAMGLVVGQYLIAENYVKIYFCITLLGAIINVGLNYLMIPVYGIAGAAIASVISYLIVPISLVFFRKTRGDMVGVFRG